MVYVPPPNLVNPAVVHPTSISSSTAPTTPPTHTPTTTNPTPTPTSKTPPLTTSKTINATPPPLRHSTCDAGCKATLGVVIPVVLLSVVAIVVYFAWGRTFLRQRKERKVEEGIAVRKLGSVSEWEGDGDGGDGVRKEGTGRWWKK